MSRNLSLGKHLNPSESRTASPNEGPWMCEHSQSSSGGLALTSCILLLGFQRACRPPRALLSHLHQLLFFDPLSTQEDCNISPALSEHSASIHSSKWAPQNTHALVMWKETKAHTARVESLALWCSGTCYSSCFNLGDWRYHQHYRTLQLRQRATVPFHCLQENRVLINRVLQDSCLFALIYPPVYNNICWKKLRFSCLRV